MPAWVIVTSDGTIHEGTDPEERIALLDQYGPEVVSDDSDDAEEVTGVVGVCVACGQVIGIPEYDAALRGLHWRRTDGRQHGEALVYTQSDLEEAGWYDDDEARESVLESMERSMIARGLCGTCGRPDLRGVTPDQIMSEADAQDLAEMHAEQAAERRAGC